MCSLWPQPHVTCGIKWNIGASHLPRWDQYWCFSGLNLHSIIGCIDSGSSVRTFPRRRLPWWWCHCFNNYKRPCLQIRNRLFSSSKSVPLEQMVLGAGGRPLPHLNLDSTAHPRPGAGAKTVFQRAQSSIGEACFSGRYVNAESVGCAFRKCSASIFFLRVACWMEQSSNVLRKSAD